MFLEVEFAREGCGACKTWVSFWGGRTAGAGDARLDRGEEGEGRDGRRGEVGGWARR